MYTGITRFQPFGYKGLVHFVGSSRGGSPMRKGLENIYRRLRQNDLERFLCCSTTAVAIIMDAGGCGGNICRYGEPRWDRKRVRYLARLFVT